MLTKDDLQAIRGIIKEEVQKEVEHIDAKQNDRLNKTENSLKELLKKELKPIHKQLKKLDKKIDTIWHALDPDIIEIYKKY